MAEAPTQSLVVAGQAEPACPTGPLAHPTPCAAVATALLRMESAATLPARALASRVSTGSPINLMAFVPVFCEAPIRRVSVTRLVLALACVAGIWLLSQVELNALPCARAAVRTAPA